MYTRMFRVSIEPVKEEFSRDTYWTRVHLQADRNRDTSVLVCASLEFLWNKYGRREFTQEFLSQWAVTVADQWKIRGEELLDNPIHYDVYAVTEEGRMNGFEFLKKEVVA